MIYNTVHARTGNLQVQHVDYWPDMDPAKRLVRPDEVIAEIEKIPSVDAFAPRIQTAALVSTEERTFGAMIQGIDPVRELRTSTLANVVREGEYLEAGDPEGALVGITLASNLGAGIGDELVFIGQGADGSLAAGKVIIRGLLKTGISEFDRSLIAASIETIGEAYSMYGAVTEIAILLKSDEDRGDAQAALGDGLRARGRDDAAVLDWTTLMPGVEQAILLDWWSAHIIYLALVLVVGFGIANTFLMAYLERIHELGIMLALGMKPRRLSVLVFSESVLLILAGIVSGVAVGAAVVTVFHRRGINFGDSAEEMFAEFGMSPIIHPLLNEQVLLSAVGITFIVSMLVAVYPAAKAAGLKPIEALRR